MLTNKKDAPVKKVNNCKMQRKNMWKKENSWELSGSPSSHYSFPLSWWHPFFTAAWPVAAGIFLPDSFRDCHKQKCPLVLLVLLTCYIWGWRNNIETTNLDMKLTSYYWLRSSCGQVYNQKVLPWSQRENILRFEYFCV